ncbi:MAG: hypothetical protein ABJQ70_05150 [Roseobacter sp.]
MDVILHLGAHRTGTASFQDYMHQQALPLREQGVEFWGPGIVHGGTFTPTTKGAKNSARKKKTIPVGQRLAEAKARGVKQLILSDADVLGSIANNLQEAALYPKAVDRLSAFQKAFGTPVHRVLFSPRSLELYWCSALSQAVVNAEPIPSTERLCNIAMSQRGWRDVVADIAKAFPNSSIEILPYEKCVGRPEVVLQAVTDAVVPLDVKREWLNRTPTLPALRRVLNDLGTVPKALPFGMGKWNPFQNEEHVALREMHADDMMWLISGADGLATLSEDCRKQRAGQTPPLVAQVKGRCDELEERQVARPG